MASVREPQSQSTRTITHIKMVDGQLRIWFDEEGESPTREPDVILGSDDEMQRLMTLTDGKVFLDTSRLLGAKVATQGACIVRIDLPEPATAEAREEIIRFFKYRDSEDGDRTWRFWFRRPPVDLHKPDIEISASALRELYGSGEPVAEFQIHGATLTMRGDEVIAFQPYEDFVPPDDTELDQQYVAIVRRAIPVNGMTVETETKIIGPDTTVEELVNWYQKLASGAAVGISLEINIPSNAESDQC